MAWYDQLFTDLKAYTAAVATDVKAILPRLIPAGGTDGQVLTKNGAANYGTKWSTASGGNPATNPDAVNGFLQGTDRLNDITTVSGMGSRQGYFHQIIAERAHLVGGFAFNVSRTGSPYNAQPLANAIGIFDLAGNPLATAEVAEFYVNQTGWKRAYFANPFTLVAGTRYVLGILGTGDNIPSFIGTAGNFTYNYNTGGVMRCFKKYNVNSFSSQLNFSVDCTANNDERIYIGLIPPA